MIQVNGFIHLFIFLLMKVKTKNTFKVSTFVTLHFYIQITAVYEATV